MQPQSVKIRQQHVLKNKFHTLIYPSPPPCPRHTPSPRLRQTLLPTGGPLAAASSVRLSPRASALTRSPAGVCRLHRRQLCHCCGLGLVPASTSFIFPALPTVRLYEAVTLLYVPAISCQSLMHATLCVTTAMCVRACARLRE